MGSNRDPSRYAGITMGMAALAALRRPCSLYDLAETLGVSHRTARRVLHALRAAGVNISRRTGQNRRAYYQAVD